MWERYANGMEPATRHLCFSVSKSVVATVAGIFVGRGELDPGRCVTDLIEELAGTSWEGATVQQVLDMRTGTAFSEVYAEVGGDTDIFGQVIGWFPRHGPVSARSTPTPISRGCPPTALTAGRSTTGRRSPRCSGGSANARAVSGCLS